MTYSARVAATLSFPTNDLKARHNVGSSTEFGRGHDLQGGLPQASVLLIEGSDSGVLLIRYASNGRFAGDTWHPTVDEAKEQAIYEFGKAVSVWKEVPTDVNDIVAFMTPKR